MTSESRAALREKVARAIYERTGGTKWDILEEEGTKEDYRIEADAAIDVVLEEAARLTDAQSQAFRDEAHNQKAWGDKAMSKRALSIAHHFAQHAAAIRAMKGKD